MFCLSIYESIHTSSLLRSSHFSWDQAARSRMDCLFWYYPEWVHSQISHLWISLVLERCCVYLVKWTLSKPIISYVPVLQSMVLAVNYMLLLREYYLFFRFRFLPRHWRYVRHLNLSWRWCFLRTSDVVLVNNLLRWFCRNTGDTCAIWQFDSSQFTAKSIDHFRAWIIQTFQWEFCDKPYLPTNLLIVPSSCGKIGQSVTCPPVCYNCRVRITN